jgi:hypothetical protein
MGELDFARVLHNNRITNPMLVEAFVASRLAYKTDWGCQVTEPLVLEALERIKAESSIGKAILAHYESDQSKMAKWGVVYSLSQYKGPVSEWVEQFAKFSELTMCELGKFTISHALCGEMEDFNLDAPLLLKDTSPLFDKKIIIAKSKLTLPDILLLCIDEDDNLCLISIQIKTWADRLNNSESFTKKEAFGHAIRSTCRPNFLDGSMEKHKKELQSSWKEAIKDRKVIHLRVLITWAGFTDAQRNAVNIHNNEHPNQPVLLITGIEHPKLYGEKIYWVLKQHIKAPTRENKTKTQINPSILKMKLLSNEDYLLNDEAVDELSKIL